jgi:hypothetical protein
VTRLDECGVVVESACVSATSEGFVDITLTKVNQDRQDALQLTANGNICVDKPKGPILRWYEVNLQFCLVDPELLNIMTADPIVLNDAEIPEAVGWDTEVGSQDLSFFALEFWVGTEDEGCDDGSIVYGYGVLPFMRQGVLTDLTFGNAVATFTVNAITKGNSQWGVGPYNVLINESGANAGLPGPLLTSIGPKVHKRFFWTTLAPPEGVCGCQALPAVLVVLPLTGLAAVLRTMTFPLDDEGAPILPASVSWGDASADVIVTSGTSLTHTYVAGTYNATFTPTGFSSPTYTSADIVVT